jgi:hypothetical protein
LIAKSLALLPDLFFSLWILPKGCLSPFVPA